MHPQKRTHMSELTKKLLIAAAFIILLAWALYPRLTGSGNNSGDGSAQQTTVLPERDNRLAVRTHIVGTTDFSNRIFATGTVRADDQIILRTETSGIITGIHFTEGQRLTEGELLLKINDADLQAELRRAEYRMNLAKIREERVKNLIERNAIAQEEYDIALNELNVIRAEMDLIQSRIEKTEIRAPFDGQIGLKNVSLGEYITPQAEIATFQNIDNIKIDFSISERYSNVISTGRRFSFKRQGSDKYYTGTVYAIEPRIDSDTRTLIIRGIAPNDDRRILPGAFVEVDLELESIRNAVLVPSEAIIPVMGGQSVFVHKNGRAESQSVSIGVRTDTQVQITGGLAPGDTLITTGVLQLRNGMPVRIAEIR